MCGAQSWSWGWGQEPQGAACRSFFLFFFHLSINLFYFLFFFYKAFKILILFGHLCFWPHCTACWILVPQPGIEPMPPALEGQSLTHWTTRKIAACISCAGCHHEERGSRDDQAKFPLSGVPDPTPIASAPVTLSQPRMCDLCFWQNEMFNHLGMFRLVCELSHSVLSDSLCPFGL